MTPEEAERGCIEVMLPTGGCVQVGFGDDLSANPELEAAVVRMMLDAEGSDRDVCQAIVDYAGRSGLGARFFLGSRDLAVLLFDIARSGPAGAHSSLA